MISPALPKHVVHSIWVQVEGRDVSEIEISMIHDTRGAPDWKRLLKFTEIAMSPPHFAKTGEIAHALGIPPKGRLLEAMNNIREKHRRSR